MSALIDLVLSLLSLVGLASDAKAKLTAGPPRNIGNLDANDAEQLADLVFDVQHAEMTGNPDEVARGYGLRDAAHAERARDAIFGFQVNDEAFMARFEARVAERSQALMGMGVAQVQQYAGWGAQH